MSYLVFFISLIILVIILKIMMLPIKIICRVLINSIAGGIVLYFLAKVGIFMAITWWSLLLTGILGIPGVVIAIILSMIL